MGKGTIARTMADLLAQAKDPAEAARIQRAIDAGRNTILYHGTHTDFPAVDPSKVDLGLHLGTSEQATNRLTDLAKATRGTNRYNDGAQIMPVAVRMDKTLDMRDVGGWESAVQAALAMRKHPALKAHQSDIDELLDSVDYMREQFLAANQGNKDAEKLWLASDDNKRALSDINSILTRDGYDSIKYHNEVENTDGVRGGLLEEYQQEAADIDARMREIKQAAIQRRPPPPDMNDPNLETSMQEFLARSPVLENYMTPEEKDLIQKYGSRHHDLRMNEQYRNDPYSYIVLKPENLRSISAQFDPEFDLSPNLMKAEGGLVGLADKYANGNTLQKFGKGQLFSIKGGLSDAAEAALPSNAKTYYHGGQLAGPISETGRLFDGIFVSPSKAAAKSHGESLYSFEIPPEKIARSGDFMGYSDIPWEQQKASIRRTNSSVDVDGPDLDLWYKAVVDDKADQLAHDDLVRIFGREDAGEALWEAQRQRGRLAKELGYDAVNMNDEHGTSVLLVRDRPYSKVEKAADDLAGFTAKAPIDTPEFKNFFGKSKVVDADGDPVIMVHASPRSDISSFRLGADNGVWFSPSFDTSEADIVASEGRKLIYNPDPNNFPDVAEGMTFYPSYLSIKNPVLDDDMLTDFYNGDITAKELRAQGFDGLQWPDGVAVVLSPTQIKSAIGNKGTYDPLDPDITKRDGGLVELADKYNKGGLIQKYQKGNLVRQWLKGYPEKSLAPLKRADVEKPEVAALNNWIDTSLAKYIKRDYGSPNDPLALLAPEQRHVPLLDEGRMRDSQTNAVWPPRRPTGDIGLSGVSSDTLDWLTNPSGRPKAYIDQVMAENPWLASLPKETILYGDVRIHDLGLQRLRDGLHNAMRPDSDLPDMLRLKPESLPRVSVAQASQLVGKINAWRAAESAKAELAASMNPATLIHKEYPEKNMRWVEIKPKDKLTKLPEGYSIGPSSDMSRQSGRYVLRYPLGDEAPLGSYATEEEAIEKALRLIGKDDDGGYQSIRDAMEYESDQMHHCLGNPDSGYCDDVFDGMSRVFSLRDKRGAPHVTIETSGPKSNDMLSGDTIDEVAPGTFDDYLEQRTKRGGYADLHNYVQNVRPDVYEELMRPEIRQVKGHGDRMPVDRYLPFVQDFVKSQKWGDVGDLRHTGLRRAAEAFQPYSITKARAEGIDLPDYLTEQEIADITAKLQATNRPNGMKEGGMAKRPDVRDNLDNESYEESKRRKKTGVSMIDSLLDPMYAIRAGIRAQYRPSDVVWTDEDGNKHSYTAPGLANSTVGLGMFMPGDNPMSDAAMAAYTSGLNYENEMGGLPASEDMGKYTHFGNTLGEVLGQLPIGAAGISKGILSKAAMAIPDYLGPFMRPSVGNYASAALAGEALPHMIGGMMSLAERYGLGSDVPIDADESDRLLASLGIESAGRKIDNAGIDRYIAESEAREAARDRIATNVYGSLPAYGRGQLVKGVDDPAKAAREARGISKSKRRVGSTGKYVGAPTGVDSPQALAAMRAKYLQDVQAGVKGRKWYGDSSDWIQLATSDDTQAEQLAKALGVTSQGTGVDTNLGFTINAFNQRAMGQPVSTGRFPSNQSPLIESILDDAGTYIGPKRDPFARNLSVNWSPELAIHPVHDIWQGRAFGYTNPDGSPWDGGFSPQQHAFMDEEMKFLIDRANKTGLGGYSDWDPLKAQAAAWTGAKVRAGDIDPDDAAKHFGSFAPKYRAAATHEQAPGAGSGHLADLLSMPYEDRLAYQMDPRSSWVDGKGRDRLYAAAGLITEPSERMVGAYTPAGGTLEINPGEVARPLVMTADGAVTARDRQLMDIVESSRAFVDAQNAGAWHKPVPHSQTSTGARSSLSIPLETNPSPEAMSALSALANKYGMFAVDTGKGVNLINDPWSGMGASRTGTTLGKELKGDMGKELEAQLGNIVPERYKIDTGYQNYQDVLSQPGSGLATQRFLDKLDENRTLMSGIEPELRAKAHANMLRDEQMATEQGMSVRPDIQLARKILAADGVKGLRDALKAGVILPAAAVAILLPMLNQPQDSQPLELAPGS